MWDALHASMRHWYRLIGAGSEGARTLERDGVVAALVPASPQRSVVNAVVYEHPDALAAAYDEIAAAYDEIGAKWTVWVHNGDSETVALLESKGTCSTGPRGDGGRLRSDTAAAPARRRALRLDRRGRPGRRGRDQRPRLRLRRRLVLARAHAPARRRGVHIYVVHQDGAAVGCCAATDTGSNTEVQMVAVVPEARGQGLSAS